MRKLHRITHSTIRFNRNNYSIQPDPTGPGSAKPTGSHSLPRCMENERNVRLEIIHRWNCSTQSWKWGHDMGQWWVKWVETRVVHSGRLHLHHHKQQQQQQYGKVSAFVGQICSRLFFHGVARVKKHCTFRRRSFALYQRCSHHLNFITSCSSWYSSRLKTCRAGSQIFALVDSRLTYWLRIAWTEKSSLKNEWMNEK